MQRITYTVDIDEEIYGDPFLLETLNVIIEQEVGCKVIRSRIETDEEIIEIGEWEGD